MSFSGLPHVIDTLVDFGSPRESPSSQFTVTDEIDIDATATITCYPLAIATSNHDAEDAAVEQITATCTSITPGTGFTVEVNAPNGTWGQYYIRSVWH